MTLAESWHAFDMVYMETVILKLVHRLPQGPEKVKCLVREASLIVINIGNVQTFFFFLMNYQWQKSVEGQRACRKRVYTVVNYHWL